MEVVQTVRRLRTEMNIDPGRRVPLLFRPHHEAEIHPLAAHRDLVLGLARLASAEETRDLAARGAAARAVAAGVDLALPLDQILDVAAERNRLKRDVEKLEREREGHAARLRNPDFLSRARPEVIDKVRGIDHEIGEKLDRLRATLRSLQGS
jgi:valyl-tRNA synthetase